MFYYNYKWNITFKNCESLCCTPETYNIVHQLYLDFKKKRWRAEGLNKHFPKIQMADI